MKKNGFVCVVCILIYCFVLRYMFHVIFPFALAVICYLMIKPAIDYLERHFHIRRNAIGVSLLLVIYLIIALLLGVVITYATLFFMNVFEDIPTYYQDILLPFFQHTYIWLENQFPFFMSPDYLFAIQDFIGQYMLQIMGSVSSFITHIPSFLFTFFLFITSTFFLVLDYDAIKDKMFAVSSRQFIQSFIHIKNQCLQSLRIYFKCQFILMCFTFLILCIGFFVMKMTHPFFYAFCTALLDSLPFIGVGIVLLPLSLVYILQGAYLKAIYIFLVYLIINVSRSLLEPRIMNKQMKIPSFLLLLSMMIHLYFFGIIGMILSPIHMSLIYSFLDYQSQK